MRAEGENFKPKNAIIFDENTYISFHLLCKPVSMRLAEA